jgi:predicted transcriptional regulator
MNPVTLSELDKALDALVMAEIIPPIAEDDITIVKICERYEKDHKVAKKIIKKLVADGKLEYVGKRQARSNGRIVDAWKMKGL